MFPFYNRFSVYTLAVKMPTIANEKISFEVKFVQCMFIFYFELSKEAPYPSTR
jgi:hypothetical protein